MLTDNDIADHSFFNVSLFDGDTGRDGEDSTDSECSSKSAKSASSGEEGSEAEYVEKDGRWDGERDGDENKELCGVRFLRRTRSRWGSSYWEKVSSRSVHMSMLPTDEGDGDVEREGRARGNGERRPCRWS